MFMESKTDYAWIFWIRVLSVIKVGFKVMWTPSVIKIYIYIFFSLFFSNRITHYFAQLKRYFLYLFLHCFFVHK